MRDNKAYAEYLKHIDASETKDQAAKLKDFAQMLNLARAGVGVAKNIEHKAVQETLQLIVSSAKVDGVELVDVVNLSAPHEELTATEVSEYYCLAYIKAYHALKILKRLNDRDPRGNKNVAEFVALLTQSLLAIPSPYDIDQEDKDSLGNICINLPHLVFIAVNSQMKNDHDAVMLKHKNYFSFVLHTYEEKKTKAFYTTVITQMLALMQDQTKACELGTSLGLTLPKVTSLPERGNNNNPSPTAAEEQLLQGEQQFKKSAPASKLDQLVEQAIAAIYACPENFYVDRITQKKCLSGTVEHDISTLKNYASTASAVCHNEKQITAKFNEMLNKYCKGASPQMRKVGELLFIIGILTVLVGVAIATAAAYPAVATTLLVNQFINATFLTAGLATAAAGVAATALGGGMMLFARPGPAGRALQQVQTEVNHQHKLCHPMTSPFERFYQG